MGHWGVKSYEMDEADWALDAGLDRVHGAAYESLMDDRNPLTIDQIQKKLAGTATLAAALDALDAEFGVDRQTWDDEAKLAFAGIVVRHAELGVPLNEDIRRQAIEWLEAETIEWDEATLRGLCKGKEIALLKRAATVEENR